MIIQKFPLRLVEKIITKPLLTKEKVMKKSFIGFLAPFE